MSGLQHNQNTNGDDAMIEQTELTLSDGSQPTAMSFESTGNPIMDMAQRASIAGDVATLKELLAIRDAEDKRSAVAEFNAAFARMQADMPIVPKRGRGHNNIQYARIEDIYQVAMPILAKHGLSLRHRIGSDEKGGITVTAVLAHVSGHSETAEFTSSPDGSGSKNSIQAKGSAITYGKRYTAEAVLGLTSHGEDDDAFAAEDSDILSTWRTRIGEIQTIDEANQLRAELMSDTDVSGSERTTIGHVWTAKRKTLGE